MAAISIGSRDARHIAAIRGATTPATEALVRSHAATKFEPSDETAKAHGSAMHCGASRRAERTRVLGTALRGEGGQQHEDGRADAHRADERQARRRRRRRRVEQLQRREPTRALQGK